jgi:hypothetical protein
MLTKAEADDVEMSDKRIEQEVIITIFKNTVKDINNI